MDIGKFIASMRMEIIDIAKKYGAKEIRLFGSIARGEGNETSDVDFLVEMTEGSTLLDIVAIKQDLEDILGRKVDVVTRSSISPYIRDEILKEAVNL